MSRCCWRCGPPGRRRPSARWYRLEAGARIESGDVLDVSERAQLQLEPSSGAVISAIGPAFGYIEEQRSDAKTPPAPQITLVRGWLKAANGAKAPPVRLDLPSSALRIDLAISLGPIEKVVAKEAAQQAHGCDEFVHLVAEHIGTQDRRAFLREVGAEDA